MLAGQLRKCLSAVIKITITLIAISILLPLRNMGAAEQVVLEVNGKKRVVKTRVETVGELLKESKIRVTEADMISPNVSTHIVSGMKVKVRKAVPIFVEIEGQERKIVTSAYKVKDVLTSHNIEFKPNDKINPPLSSPVTRGMRIRIAKEIVVEERVSEPIAFRTIKKRDGTLPVGKKVIQQQGQTGFMERVFRVTYLGGEVVAQQLVEEVVKVKPLAEIIKIGTLRPFIVSRGQESIQSREQGADGAPDPNQPVTYNNNQEGTASYYTLNGKGVGMTAAHRTLPYGTKVRVTNLSNSKQVEVVINDRGPYRKDRIIDLATDAFRAIASTSQGVCRVRIEW